MAKEEKRRSKDIARPSTAEALPAATEENSTAADPPETTTEAQAKQSVDSTSAAAPEPAPRPSTTEDEEEPDTPVQPAEGLAAVAPTATTSSNVATSTPTPVQTTEEPKKSSTTSPPTSPTRSERGFRSLFSKLRRKSRATTPGEIKSFTGGHRLSKAGKEDEEEPRSQSTSGVPAIAVESSTQPGNEASPSISSLSDSDAGEDEIYERPRGRQRLSLKDLNTNVGESSTASHPTENETFEEARDKFDELSPPQPSFSTKKEGSASPHRDSKFLEEF